jgi:sulfatase maturation enzyme AslB (radical SAM superfamily)
MDDGITLVKSRKEEAANYSSVFLNGKTLRMPLDPELPITELEYPEFYDVGINTKCNGGCPFCYTSAIKNGVNFDNVCGKIDSFFGNMTPNQRPYQVALGGSGEALMHPEFIDIIKNFAALDIVPNYTTNGMHFSREILSATAKYCGGVAISLHPHLEKVWRKGIEKILGEGIRLNVHVIVSDAASIDLFRRVYEEYEGIEYFVLLPHMNVGFAAQNPKEINYSYLESALDKVASYGKIAFGSNFYEFLKKINKYGISLYPPEIMSKYLIMDDDMWLYNNSFECKKVRRAV